MKRLYLLLSLLIAITARAVTYSGTLPVLFINTENNTPITSKEAYLRATYYLDNMGIEGVKSIGSKEEPLGMQIRGRGNYSWVGFDKKPYRLKLDDKQPLLGMNKSKHFALLAHADDNYGFMRNIVGFQLSRMIGMPWTPADAPVEVVLNGDYIGLYFLTETIRVDKDRVNIVEQPDFATSPEEITGGWLVEIDNYDSDPHITLYEKDSQKSKIIFTYKTPEELSPEQEEYLTAQMTVINDAIYNEDLNDNTWEEYVDTDILARYYIVQEIVDDYESFHGSCYLYKNQGDGKWMFGPVWDFGNAFSYDKTQYIYEGRVWHNTWIKQMCRHEHFMGSVRKVFNEFYATSFNDIYDYVDQYAERIKAAALCDAQRWPSYGNWNFDERINQVKTRLKLGVNWLSDQWTEPTTYTVWFRDNGTPAWEKVYAYVWTYDGNNVQVILGGWPGTEIAFDDSMNAWKCEVKSKALLENAMIIFNNGKSKNDNQTPDFEFINGAVYDRSGIIEGIDNPFVADRNILITTVDGQVYITSPTDTIITACDITGHTYPIIVTAGITIVDTLSPGFYIINGVKVITTR